MKRTRYALLTLAAFTILFLSSCVNLVQEITILEDGSGSLRFDLGMQTEIYPQFQEALPEGYELQNLLATLIADENVTEVIQDQYETDGRTWDSIQLNLSDVAAVLAEDRRVGPITISIDTDGSVYTFSQTVDVANSNFAIPGVNMIDLGGAGYTIRLITPQIISTTGIQESGGTTTWDVPLGELLQEGDALSQRAEYSLEPYEGTFIPWELFFPYVVIGFLSLGGIAVLVVIIFNTQGKRDKGKKYIFKK